MAAAVLQTRISAILDVLTKAAVAEISQLIQDDSAVYHREMKRREDEIDGLKKRLLVTEKELKKVQATVLARCTVGVQVEIPAAGRKEAAHVDAFRANPGHDLKDEKPQLPDKTPAPSQHLFKEPRGPPESRGEKRRDPRRNEEEFSSLEFEMKIEQVEELVDQELNLQRADYGVSSDPSAGSEHKADPREAHLWPSMEDDAADGFSVPEGCMVLEQYEQISAEQSLAVKESANPHKHVDSFASPQMQFEHGFPKNSEYGQIRDGLGHAKAARPLNGARNRHAFGAAPRSHSHLSAASFSIPDMVPMRQTAQASHAGSKPFRCEECGKGFTQRMRLITHKRIHTGEKPYHCQLCGKMFSRQDNCLRHVRLHNVQGW